MVLDGVAHRGKDSKQINITKYVSKFLINGAKMLDKCVKNVWNEPKTKYILKTFKVEESLWNQKQSCLEWKIGLEKCCPFFDFVCFNGRHFT